MMEEYHSGEPVSYSSDNIGDVSSEGADYGWSSEAASVAVEAFEVAAKKATEAAIKASETATSAGAGVASAGITVVLEKGAEAANKANDTFIGALQRGNAGNHKLDSTTKLILFFSILSIFCASCFVTVGGSSLQAYLGIALIGGGIFDKEEPPTIVNKPCDFCQTAGVLKCITCDGNGYTVTNQEDDAWQEIITSGCRTCGGSGAITEVIEIYGDGSSDYTEDNGFNPGTGTLECLACQGHGYIESEE